MAIRLESPNAFSNLAHAMIVGVAGGLIIAINAARGSVAIGLRLDN